MRWHCLLQGVYHKYLALWRFVDGRPTHRYSAEWSQVEEIVFESPRYRFTEHSAVFEDMFRLPNGSNGNVEGRDEEHPIVLDGYKANDFSALMKVLYPE